ncbi:hypothetical protein F5X68DRAFT_210258 [Plectosphaerella plurivora]|uniref:VOC domain-containing protein n=1 Tax=Plectosphaerella plurivora TaxID=936078 RepID=A0A9P8V869_9PEZI|nr:hypothetical protein F5X68DRAFT_210258 [Plectosphaerella plurivora]
MSRENKPNFFLNISAADPTAAETFFKALGLTLLPDWSMETTKTFLLPAPNQKICLMVHAPDCFRQFIRPGSDIVDAHTSTETLFSLAVDSREEVDSWIDNAVNAGGKADPYKIEDFGKAMGMYTRAFSDLDGHIWEVLTDLPGSTCAGAGSGEKKE